MLTILLITHLHLAGVAKPLTMPELTEAMDVQPSYGYKGYQSTATVWQLQGSDVRITINK